VTDGADDPGPLPARPSEKSARGREAEAAAEAMLLRTGLTLLARNHACPQGEVDLVCLDGETVVFVEVRSRAEATSGRPSETISPAKRRRVILAATDWLVREQRWDKAPVRFDVVEVLGLGEAQELVHLCNAFDADGEPS
jgi:putative endonuclease